jgi:myosin heavy subunit
MLSTATWPVWGSEKGDVVAGCVRILNDLGVKSDEWVMGKTKVFLKNLQTVRFRHVC